MGIHCQTSCNCKANQATETPHLGAAMRETSEFQWHGSLFDLAIQSDQTKKHHLNLKQRFLEKGECYIQLRFGAFLLT